MSDERIDPRELAHDGWESVNLETNAYTGSYFEKLGADPDAIGKFLDEEVDDWRLVGLSESHDFDYALERKQTIGTVKGPYE